MSAAARADQRDVLGHVASAHRRFLDARADSCERGILRPDALGDAGAYLVELANRALDARDGRYAAAGRGHHRVDVFRDVVRRTGRLLCQALDLGGYDGEPLADVSGARGLDRRVEREEIGLRGDVRDELHDPPYLTQHALEALHGRIRVLHFRHRRVRGLRRVGETTGNLPCTPGELLGRRGDRVHVLRGVLGGMATADTCSVVAAAVSTIPRAVARSSVAEAATLVTTSLISLSNAMARNPSGGARHRQFASLGDPSCARPR